MFLKEAVLTWITEREKLLFKVWTKGFMYSTGAWVLFIIIGLFIRTKTLESKARSGRK